MQLTPKNEPKKTLKIEPKQLKTIWYVLDLEIAWFFVQPCFNKPYLPHFNFELWYVWNVGFLLPKLQNHMWFALRDLLEIILILS